MPLLITEGAKVRHDGSSTCVDIYVSHCDKLESVSDDAFLGVHLCYVSALFYSIKINRYFFLTEPLNEFNKIVEMVEIV